MNPVQKMYFDKKISTIEYLINLANIKVKADINFQNLVSKTIDYDVQVIQDIEPEMQLP